MAGFFIEMIKIIPVEVSARHVHLSKRHLAVLFGVSYKLNVNKSLSQPGQFSVKEKVILETPKGRIENVTIIGPVRSATQVEISVTDARKLGLNVPVRLSGDLKNSAGIKIIGPKKSVHLNAGVIVAARHIHCDPGMAEKWNLRDGGSVSVEVMGLRPITFHQVIVRVHPEFKLAFHLDTDEANAVFGNGKIGKAFII